MHKLIIVFIVTIMSFTLASCGGEDSDVEYTLNTDVTDQLTLNTNYEGTTLDQEGIEEVSLISCEDGDTAVFDTSKGEIRVRFLGIDTPEASYKYDPWGLQATQFTCEKLYQANTLVIEQDEAAGPVDNYGRHLGYVWYDGRLLNLEVVEQAYSLAVGVEKLKYSDEFLQAQAHASLTNLRLYGEEDPLFDYSSSGIDVTVEEIVTNKDDYILQSVNVEGVITRKLGTHVFIEQDGFGIFVYTGYDTSAKLVVGNEVRFEKMQVIYDLRRRGGLHLARFNVRTVSLLSEGNSVNPETMDIKDIDIDDFGRFVRFEQVLIINVEQLGDTWKIIVEQYGVELILYQPLDVIDENRLSMDVFSVGQELNVQGILQDSLDGTQLLVLESNDVTIVD